MPRGYIASHPSRCTCDKGNEPCRYPHGFLDSRNHRVCPCGCGELADECAGPVRNPLGSMTTRY